MRLFLFVLLTCLASVARIAPAQELFFPPQTVVASRGGARVTMQDIDEYMQRVPADKRAGLMRSPRRIEALLLSMLLNEQLAKQAEDMKLGDSAEARGTTGWHRVEVLSKLRMERFMRSIRVPDLGELAREEYIGHRDDYVRPERVDIQRILIHSKLRGRAETRDLAYDVQHQAMVDPNAFDALVEKYSDDPDKEKTHGVIKDVYSTHPDQRLRAALNSVHKAGAISKPYRAQDGFQIIKVLNIEPSIQLSFDQVRGKILEALKQNYIDTRRRDFIDNLSSERMDANPDAIASLPTRYAWKRPAATPPPAPQGNGAVHRPAESATGASVKH